METIKYPSETKAIKEHQCNWCGFKISKGESYLKSTHSYEGEIYDWKTHKHCSKLVQDMEMTDYHGDGITQEDFIETASSKHNDLMYAFFQDDEIKKYSDVIQQAKNANWRSKLSYVIRHYAKQNP